MKNATGEAGLAALLGRLVEEKRRIARLLQQVDEALRNAPAVSNTAKGSVRDVAPPRPGPLDQVKAVMAATADLRVANGNLSADSVANLFGVSLSRLAAWLGRSRQALQVLADVEMRIPQKKTQVLPADDEDVRIMPDPKSRRVRKARR